MLKIKSFIVRATERSCDMTHWVTHHRPWLWLPRLPGGLCVHCPLADLSDRLDERWGTGRWAPAEDIDDDD